MARVKGKIIITVMDNNQGSVHAEGLTALDAVQALNTTAAQIIVQEKQKIGREAHNIILPGGVYGLGG